MDVNEFIANLEAMAGPLPSGGTGSDWRSHTCGECGWKMRGMCRRVMWGETPQWTDQSGLWTQPSYFGDVQDGDAACPAFVAASIAAGKE